MKKKLSASAGNLWETGRAVEGENGENSYAQMQLSKTIKEKVGWSIACLLWTELWCTKCLCFFCVCACVPTGGALCSVG